MLLVAFSRRMCCSRVCSASRSAGAPSASTLTPTSRPGIDRSRPLRTAMKPACGPPKPSGTPNRWLLPTATSAPSSPGLASRVRASRSAATVDQRAALVRLLDERPQVAHGAGGAGVLQQDAEGRAVGQPGDRSATSTRRPSGSARVRRTAIVCGCVSASTTNAASLPALLERRRQRHRLGGRGRLVEQAGAGDVEAGQVDDDGLEVEQHLQPALADLRLVRRVGGVPGRVLHDVAQHDRRGVGAGVAGADHRRDGACCAPRSPAARRAPAPRRRPAAGRGARWPGSRPARRPRPARAASRGRPRRASWRSRPSRGPMCRSVKGAAASSAARVPAGERAGPAGAAAVWSSVTTGLSGALGRRAGRASRWPPRSVGVPESFTPACGLSPSVRPSPEGDLLSRGASSTRSTGLRGSRGELLLRRPPLAARELSRVVSAALPG